MRIEKRVTSDGRERYRCLVRRQGSPALSKTFGHYADAEQWGIENERRILRERAGLSAPATRATIAQLVALYNAADHPSAEDSGRDRLRHLEWWVRRIGREPAARVRPRQVRLALGQLRRVVTDDDGNEVEKSASPATKNRYLSSLSALYRWAQEGELLETNPARLVRRAPERSRRIRYLTDDEREALLPATADHAQRPKADRQAWRTLEAMVLVSLWTGGRQGEVLGLRWRDVDQERQLIHYPSTKGGNPRAVPAPPEVFAALARLGVGKPAAKVFSHWPRRPWRKALGDAAVEGFRWHDLRHSFCSWLVQRGVPIADVQQLAGHRSIQTTLRYAHLAPTDAHERVRNALSQHAQPPAKVLAWPLPG